MRLTRNLHMRHIFVVSASYIKMDGSARNPRKEESLLKKLFDFRGFFFAVYRKTEEESEKTGQCGENNKLLLVGNN